MKKNIYQKGHYEISFAKDRLWLHIKSETGEQTIDISAVWNFFREYADFIKQPKK